MTGLDGNARYVMVQMLSLAAGKAGYLMKELQVFGDDDLASSRTVYTSTGSSTAAKAIDTSGATEWESTDAGNGWIFMDLGEAFNIGFR